MPREDRHPGPQSERQPGPNRLPFFRLRTFIVQFSHWQDFSSGGGTTTPAGEIGSQGFDRLPKGNSIEFWMTIECLCGFPDWVEGKSRYL